MPRTWLSSSTAANGAFLGPWVATGRTIFGFLSAFCSLDVVAVPVVENGIHNASALAGLHIETKQQGTQ